MAVLTLGGVTITAQIRDTEFGGNMNTSNLNPKRIEHLEEDDPVLRQIDEDHERAMVLIRRRMAQQYRSLKRWGMVALLMPLLLAVSLWFDHQRRQQVVATTPVGQLLNMQMAQKSHGASHVALLVQTHTGFYSLHEPLNLTIGAELMREERKSGRMYLCDVQRAQCAPIATPSRP